jgi:hypothetical protein
VWINGEKAPFADVIAPYCLYQCKFTETGVQDDEAATLKIKNFEYELGKCGLLKNNCALLKNNPTSTLRAKIGWAILRALEDGWKGGGVPSPKQNQVDKNVPSPKKNQVEQNVPTPKENQVEQNAAKLSERKTESSFGPEKMLKKASATKDDGINFVDLTWNKNQDFWELDGRRMWF